MDIWIKAVWLHCLLLSFNVNKMNGNIFRGSNSTIFCFVSLRFWSSTKRKFFPLGVDLTLEELKKCHPGEHVTASRNNKVVVFFGLCECV